MLESGPCDAKDVFTNSMFRSPERTYDLYYDNGIWKIFYTKNPINTPILPISEMTQTITCLCCSKEILPTENKENELFVSEGCKFKHKFHRSCIRKALTKRLE